MRARSSGGQSQHFQRNLGYPTTGKVVNEEIQGKGVTEEAVSSQLSAIGYQSNLELLAALISRTASTCIAPASGCREGVPALAPGGKKNSYFPPTAFKHFP